MCSIRRLYLATAVCVAAAILPPAAALRAQTAADSLQTAPASSGTEGLSTAALAAKLGARLSYDPLTGYCLIERGSDRAAFTADLPWALFNWNTSLQFDPPIRTQDGLSLTARAATILEKAFADAESERRSHFSVAAILIDPGHGGKDPGAIGEHGTGAKKLRVLEKDVTLSIGKMLYSSLKARYPERKILITRDDDRYPTLEERVAMANSVDLGPNEAIIYVSVHANSSFNKNATGFEVWYLNPDYRRTLVEPSNSAGRNEDVSAILNVMLEEEFTTESVMLAKRISDGLRAQVGAESPDRGIRADEWFVVRNARMPSVLIEAGFLSNPAEAALLARDDYLRRLADGIYNGIVDFVGYFETIRGGVH
jgi:N-acetylmuramoyl-L-alanine amidase